jgi:hypothetical protein
MRSCGWNNEITDAKTEQAPNTVQATQPFNRIISRPFEWCTELSQSLKGGQFLE